MSIVLYDLATADPELRFSPYCWRVKMALAHKGLTWEEVACLFTEKDRLPKPNAGTVPVLVDGDTVVGDSWQIAEHLDQRYSENPLFACGEAKSTALLVKFWIERTVQPFITRMGVGDFMSTLHEKDKPYFLESREKRFGMTIEKYMSSREQAREGFVTALEPLRAMLAEQPYVAGQQPAYVDYIVFGALQWMRCGSPFPALRQEDPVFAYRERLLDLFDGLGRKALHREVLD
ncbi:MAG TPA: glutathione S-transferase N-terminal domain-containing protein [Burkholderiales bacterium]|nr:glutathione S-transferase N-terminal domain-containing protein [Burkholderiales bacterium]